MTIICAYTDGDHTWLGSDTVGSASIGNSIVPIGHAPKWTVADGWAYANTGDAAVADWVEHDAPNLFKGLTGDPAPQFLFAARLQGLYKALDMRPTHRGDEAMGNWCNSGLLATAGRVWTIDGTLAIARVQPGEVYAMGCARPFACGAAWGYQRANPKASPEVLIDIALDAAATFDMQIRGKWLGRL